MFDFGKAAIEGLKSIINDLVHDFANMAFDWLSMFMLTPTDFSKYPKVDVVYTFVFTLASSLCIVFVAYQLLGIMFNHLAGVKSRSISEVIFKTVLAFVLSASAPWLLENVLVRLNNAIVQYFLDTGLDTSTLEDFFTFPPSAGLSIFVAAAIICVLFVILGLQYIQRIGEFIVILISSPLAAFSVINENYDIWSIWWREAISVIFTQSFQVALLWIILNQITDTQKLSDYMLSIGLMVVLLKGPKYLRQFLYSSGAGKVAVGMAGGSSKMAIYKYAASRMTK